MLPPCVAFKINCATSLGWDNGDAWLELIDRMVALDCSAIQWAEGASKEHYTLCRCGASNNKPFCDGMHRTVNFKDDINRIYYRF